MLSRLLRSAMVGLCGTIVASACVDVAPSGLRRTPPGPGATVRFDLGHTPLPDIPLPNDVATWSDPTSRTGLRLNVSLVAPTQIEGRARARINQLEGWGTFMPITLAFDVDATDPEYAGYKGAALDLANLKKRHQGDDFDFADDAVYLIDLATGVPRVLDLGAKNFDDTLKSVNSFWSNDAHASERNLFFETLDETKRGTLTLADFTADKDLDQDGKLDVPNLDDPFACPDPDPTCTDPKDPKYQDPSCLDLRRTRDRCIADHLMTWYERQTDTLILRPLLPLEQMKRYAVVVTDRTVDGKGHAVKSPFDYVYPAAQEPAAARVRDVMNDPAHAAYFGDLAGTGLDHVAFTWSFTTEPTVQDMLVVRDGLYGHGPLARLATDYPPDLEVFREVGPKAGVTKGEVQDPDGWQSTPACKKMANGTYVLRFADNKDVLRQLVVNGFGLGDGPSTEALLTALDNIDHVVIGKFSSPFFIEGGQAGTDPDTAFNMNFATGEGDVEPADVQFLLSVPKATASHKAPFDVAITGHGAGGDFTEPLLYAGNMAAHGLATIGINAVGHGRTFDSDPQTAALAKLLLGVACIGPFYDALTTGRSRDLDNDGVPDSGGDFWTAYLFHTRDVVRQSVIDHLQLVRVLRAFGTTNARMLCRNAETGWSHDASRDCDMNGDGKPEIAGDFDADGVPDVGGPTASISTWGESLGGIIAPLHGSIDTNVSTTVPGSGAGGLTDVAVRSALGSVFEPVLLRAWGPLLVGVPSSERGQCMPDSGAYSDCTVCRSGEVSVRFILPRVNGGTEVELGCYPTADLAKATLFAANQRNDEVRCTRVDANGRFRVGLPSTTGDPLTLFFYDGLDQVTDYGSCTPLASLPASPRKVLDTWGQGRFPTGAQNALMSEQCKASSCAQFEGHFFAQGAPLLAIADGYGQRRQDPDFRAFVGLIQLVLEPADPISFAPFFLDHALQDPAGNPIGPRAVFTINTIGDLDVPLSAGIAFARATGAVPFLRPDQADKYPEYREYATPSELFTALGGKTPNQVLIEGHVLEGSPELARHVAGPGCAASANQRPPGAMYTAEDGSMKLCLPSCAGGDSCPDETHCDAMSGSCVPNPLGQVRCDEALFDADDIDEGASQYFEQNASTPLRLARFAGPRGDDTWTPRSKGAPHAADGDFTPSKPIAGLLDAYIVPQGTHTFVNGNPCQSFDSGTYFTNLVARLFQSRGTDVYYLSHPSSHHCLGTDVTKCAYWTK